jgi:hypothetical protein
MVVFFRRREMVTHLLARFYKLVRVVRAISPGRERIIWPVDSLILSYQLGVSCYSERCLKKETFWASRVGIYLTHRGYRYRGHALFTHRAAMHLVTFVPKCSRRGKLKKRNLMHAKRETSSVTTDAVEAAITLLNSKLTSHFHEGEAASNVRKFPFLEFSPPSSRGG